jgi:uncharacterized protein
VRPALLISWLWLALLFAAHGAEKLPPSPAEYFNDYAGIVSKGTAAQIVVAIYPKMETSSSVADYCQRIFHSWKVGQAGKNNGAVLFVFVQEHQLWIQTGYGLEASLPDILCKQIVENEIKPKF